MTIVWGEKFPFILVVVLSFLVSPLVEQSASFPFFDTSHRYLVSNTAEFWLLGDVKKNRTNRKELYEMSTSKIQPSKKEQYRRHGIPCFKIFTDLQSSRIIVLHLPLKKCNVAHD